MYRVKLYINLRAAGRWGMSGLVALLMAFGPLVAAVSADSTYKVQPGDTLISIAARYGTSVDAIVASNGLASRSTIFAGQVLTIPSPGSVPSSTQSRSRPSGNTYTVRPGDTLSDIAVLYGSTSDAIARYNNLGSSTIYAGQTLVIPPAGSAAPPQPQPPSQPQPQANPGTYVVQSGDSIIGLANRFGVTQQALAAANGLQPFDRLVIGQTLKIPGAAPQQPQPTATPAPPPPAPPTPPAALPTLAVLPTTTPQPVSSAGGAQPGKPVQYTVQPGDNLSTIAVKFSTTVAALIGLNKLSDGNFLRVGQVLTIVKGDDLSNNAPAVTPAPEPTAPMGQYGPKWVDVNITNQTLTAFEGQVPVFSSKVSTGVPRYPTVEGTYRIYAKYKSTKMEGGQGADYYYLPNVPYTLYFYSGYALHGATWHNNFGQPMSHGCVNLPLDAAKWMFEWAPIGTLVVTHK